MYHLPSARTTDAATSEAAAADPARDSDVAVGTGNSSAARVVLIPIPMIAAGAGPASTRSAQDAAHLAPLDQHVVGPLQFGPQPGRFAHAVRHCQSGEQRQPQPAPRRDGPRWPQQRRDRQRRARAAPSRSGRTVRARCSGGRRPEPRPTPLLRGPRRRGRRSSTRSWRRCRPASTRSRGAHDLVRQPFGVDAGFHAQTLRPRPASPPVGCEEGSRRFLPPLHALGAVRRLSSAYGPGHPHDPRQGRRTRGSNRAGQEPLSGGLGGEGARPGQDDRPRARPAAARRGHLHRVRRVLPAPLHRVRPGRPSVPTPTA